MFQSLPPRARGFAKLALGVFCIWFMLWVATPFWVSFSPLHQQFAEAQETHGVPIGALYYNDLPFINEAAMTLNDTWRYLPRGPKPEAGCRWFRRKAPRSDASRGGCRTHGRRPE